MHTCYASRFIKSGEIKLILKINVKSDVYHERTVIWRESTDLRINDNKNNIKLRIFKGDVTSGVRGFLTPDSGPWPVES